MGHVLLLEKLPITRRCWKSNMCEKRSCITKVNYKWTLFKPEMWDTCTPKETGLSNLELNWHNQTVKIKETNISQCTWVTDAIPNAESLLKTKAKLWVENDLFPRDVHAWGVFFSQSTNTPKSHSITTEKLKTKYFHTLCLILHFWPTNFWKQTHLTFYINSQY